MGDFPRTSQLSSWLFVLQTFLQNPEQRFTKYFIPWNISVLPFRRCLFEYLLAFENYIQNKDIWERRHIARRIKKQHTPLPNVERGTRINHSSNPGNGRASFSPEELEHIERSCTFGTLWDLPAF